MGAKDTVLDTGGMQEAVINKPNIPMRQAIAEAQAEITWPVAHKAGREDGVKFCHRQFDANLPEIMETSKQAGIREVVEWIEEHRIVSTHPDIYEDYYPISSSPLKAKRKDWGIDEEG